MSKKNESLPDLKLFLLGDSGVGKTNFILRYTKNKFQNNYISTIGIDFLAKDVLLPNKEKVQIRFYDTAGQEHYKSIAFNLVKLAEGIILMYDISSNNSFDSMKEWIESIKAVKGDDFPVLLCGNKCDLEEQRAITKEDGEDLAKNNGFIFFETSCKENINITESVSEFALKVLEKKIKDEKEFHKLEKKKHQKKKRRC